MPLITWNDSIALGLPSMDVQHQRWIDLINNLHEAMRQGKGREVIGRTLADMADYARTHFTAEETLLTLHKYPDYAAHKAQHDAFMARVRGWQQQTGDAALTLEVMSWLKDWLVSHIQTVDRAYVPWLKSKGVR